MFDKDSMKILSPQNVCVEKEDIMSNKAIAAVLVLALACAGCATTNTRVNVPDFRVGKYIKIDADSDFVSPIAVEGEIKITKGQVAVKFAFAGEKNPERRIKVSIRLLDEAGTSLADASLICEDGRLLPDSIPHSIPFMLDKTNYERFEFPADTLRRATRIEVEFQNTKKSSNH